MAGKIVVVGSSNTDMILQTSHIPRPGETILGGEFSIAAGGKGANQAVAAARAGGDVAFVASVGDDMFGQQAIDGFVKEGINVDHIRRVSDTPSGVALIFVAESGENSIGVASGANGTLSPAEIDAARVTLQSAEWVVMQLETPLATVEHVAKLAAESGVRVILNPAPAQPLPDTLLACISVLTPNQTEAELLTGIKVDDASNAVEAAVALRSRGVETVIVTLGEGGSVFVSESGAAHVPAYRVDPVDTTAAGDVYNGALAVALAESMPLEEAMRFAGAASGLSVTKLGAQTSAPQRDQIDTFLNDGETRDAVSL